MNNSQGNAEAYREVIHEDKIKIGSASATIPNMTNQPLNNEIVHLVETMLQLQKEKQRTNLSDKLNQLEARIKYTDDKINQLVFELYGLSEEEVEIVENV